MPIRIAVAAVQEQKVAPHESTKLCSAAVSELVETARGIDPSGGLVGHVVKADSRDNLCGSGARGDGGDV